MSVETYVVDSPPTGHPELKMHRIRRRVFASAEERVAAALAGIRVFDDLPAARAQVRELLIGRKRTLEVELERIDYNLEELAALYAAVDNLQTALTARYRELVDKFGRSRSWPGSFFLGDLSVSNTVHPSDAASLYEMSLLERPLADVFTPETCALITKAMQEAGLRPQRHWYGPGHPKWNVLAQVAKKPYSPKAPPTPTPVPG